MARKPRHMSQRELDDLLDEMVASGEDEQDTPKWRAAHAEWERRTGEA